MPSIRVVVRFSAVFIALGLSATAIGSMLGDHRATLNKLAAALILVMGMRFALAPVVERVSRRFAVVVAAGRSC